MHLYNIFVLTFTEQDGMARQFSVQQDMQLQHFVLQEEELTAEMLTPY